ncbi:MAG: alpha/beta hydrolase [Planctomycetota bacterium]|nr:MAG: alpha/beta hydrolase [Planctomycetota bacterium]
MRPAAKRWLIFTPLFLVFVVTIIGVWFWRMMGEPLYQPGMVRAEYHLRSPLTPPPQPADANPWRVSADVAIHHETYGSGVPVLFVHGGPGFAPARLAPGLAALSDEFQIHIYHQRGCGRSSRPIDRFDSTNYYQNLIELDASLGLAAQIADIERIRRILRQDRLVLIGHSFGAFLAALYAAEFPRNVEALVLCAPADLLVFPIEGGGLFEIVRARLPDHLKDSYATFLDEYLDFGTVFERSESELASRQREFAKYYAEAGGLGPVASTQPIPPDNGGWMPVAAYFSMGLRHDYRAALREVAAPTLVLHGSDDLQPRAVSERYAQLIPFSELRVIAGAGHMLFDDRPEEFAETVRGFLRDALRED